MEHVELFRDIAGEYRWRRVAENGEVVADSAEGYIRRIDALQMAEHVNPGIPIEEEEDDE